MHSGPGWTLTKLQDNAYRLDTGRNSGAGIFLDSSATVDLDWGLASDHRSARRIII